MAGVVLMGLSAVLTAWAGFQSAKWSGIQSTAYSRATAERTESVRASNEASHHRSVDVASFIAWVEAIAEEDLDRADFIRARFTDRLSTAVDAWEATDPLEDDAAPPTPFTMADYVVAAQDRADELAADADLIARKAAAAGQRVEQYVLITVLFALVLFFVAMSAKTVARRSRIVLLDVAAVGFLAGAVLLLVLPIEL